MDMLKNCEEDQISTIHSFVTFEQTSKKGRKSNLNLNLWKSNYTTFPLEIKRQAWLRSTLSWKKRTYHLVTRINEIGPQEDFVEHSKPELEDAPIDRKTRLDLEKLLKANEVAFATDERQIGTPPLIKWNWHRGPPTYSQKAIHSCPQTLWLG